MLDTFRPMLAVEADPDKLSFPLLASPKLDGVRAVVRSGKVLSRKLIPIPNKKVQNKYSHLEGFDGELILGNPTASNVFNITSASCRKEKSEDCPDFHVFDRWDYPCFSFERRFNLISSPEVKIVPHIKIDCFERLAEVEQQFVSEGYEGIMLRHPDGPYKFGRSTVNEGYLLKWKRFEDGEAVLLEVLERMQNGNEQVVNELGLAERSSCKNGLIPMGRAGSLRVRELSSGIEFNIGTGLDTKMSEDFWIERNSLPGKIIKFKHQPVGRKDKPRFPVFLGFRDEWDM